MGNSRGPDLSSNQNLPCLLPRRLGQSREPPGWVGGEGGGTWPSAATVRANGGRAPPPPPQPRARSVGNKGIFSPTAHTRAAPGSPAPPRGSSTEVPARGRATAHAHTLATRPRPAFQELRLSPGGGPTSAIPSPPDPS